MLLSAIIRLCCIRHAYCLDCGMLLSAIIRLCCIRRAYSLNCSSVYRGDKYRIIVKIHMKPYTSMWALLDNLIKLCVEVHFKGLNSIKQVNSCDILLLTATYFKTDNSSLVLKLHDCTARRFRHESIGAVINGYTLGHEFIATPIMSNFIRWLSIVPSPSIYTYVSHRRTERFVIMR